MSLWITRIVNIPLNYSIFFITKQHPLYDLASALGFQTVVGDMPSLPTTLGSIIDPHSQAIAKLQVCPA